MQVKVFILSNYQMFKTILKHEKCLILDYPWYAQSFTQGVLTGLIVAQGGFGAFSLLIFLPFLDYAALSRAIYLRAAFDQKKKALRISPLKRPDYDKNISWQSSLRPIASVIINAFFATAIAPFVAPYSPLGNSTRSLYYKVISQPSTYSTLPTLEKSTSFLIDPSQAFWLRKSEVAKILSKQSLLRSVKAQEEHDSKLSLVAQYVTTTSLNDKTFKRISDSVQSLQSDSRYHLVLTKTKQQLVQAVVPKLEDYKNEVARKKSAEQKRQASILFAKARQDSIEFAEDLIVMMRDYDGTCANTLAEININFDDPRGLEKRISGKISPTEKTSLKQLMRQITGC